MAGTILFYFLKSFLMTNWHLNRSIEEIQWETFNKDSGFENYEHHSV